MPSIYVSRVENLILGPARSIFWNFVQVTNPGIVKVFAGGGGVSLYYLQPLFFRGKVRS